MKALRLALCLLAAAVGPVAAQVTVEVIQEQDQFLPGEAMPTAVRITNRSARDLRLGAEKDWLVFSVQTRGVEVVPKLGEVPVAGEFILGSSKVATKYVDLAPYFFINRTGRYIVTATVRIREWDREVTSPPKEFNVSEGAKLWEQEVGVPAAPDSAPAVPEVRKFILQQASSLKTQPRLYVRLTDATGARTFRVIPVGPTVSFGRPEPQVDKFSNLHLLHQEGARSFSYVVINPQGEIIARRTYDYGDKRPRLQPDMDGKIIVQGGVRRPTPKDVPPPQPAPAAEEEPKPLRSPGELVPPNL